MEYFSRLKKGKINKFRENEIPLDSLPLCQIIQSYNFYQQTSRYGEELKCLHVNKNLNSFRKLTI